MPVADIPEPVRRLIVDLIDSIPELEAILLLRAHRDRAWTAEEAGARLYVSVTVAAHVLAVLAERGFVARAALGFRYAPATPELDQLVATLATVYAQNLIAVTHLIHSKPATSIRQFADAFRLRKDT
jgi:hypothetical protein